MSLLKELLALSESSPDATDKWSDAVRDVLQKVVDGEYEIYNVHSDPRGEAMEQAAEIIEKMYNDTAGERGLHADDDFEEIYDLVIKDLEDMLKGKLGEAAKWRQGYRASGHPPGFKHPDGKVGPIGGAFITTDTMGGEEKKYPVDRYRDEVDPLRDRAKIGFTQKGAPLKNKREKFSRLKYWIDMSKGKHGPVNRLPEEQQLEEAAVFQALLGKIKNMLGFFKGSLKSQQEINAREVMAVLKRGNIDLFLRQIQDLPRYVENSFMVSSMVKQMRQDVAELQKNQSDQLARKVYNDLNKLDSIVKSLKMVESSPDPADSWGEHVREAREKLHAAIADQFGLGENNPMTKRIAAWLVDNATDDKVEDFLYDEFWKDMPYGTAKARTGDPANWIGDKMEDLFSDELKVIRDAESKGG